MIESSSTVVAIISRGSNIVGAKYGQGLGQLCRHWVPGPGTEGAHKSSGHHISKPTQYLLRKYSIQLEVRHWSNMIG